MRELTLQGLAWGERRRGVWELMGMQPGPGLPCMGLQLGQAPEVQIVMNDVIFSPNYLISSLIIPSYFILLPLFIYFQLQ